MAGVYAIGRLGLHGRAMNVDEFALHRAEMRPSFLETTASP
jgi:hypothetical protein